MDEWNWSVSTPKTTPGMAVSDEITLQTTRAHWMANRGIILFAMMMGGTRAARAKSRQDACKTLLRAAAKCSNLYYYFIFASQHDPLCCAPRRWVRSLSVMGSVGPVAA